jgi:hypothetical protein
MQNFKLRDNSEVKSISTITPELLALLKNELQKTNTMNNQDGKMHPVKTLKNINDIKNKIDGNKGKGTVINPKDIISLDDQDFGKF